MTQNGASRERTKTVQHENSGRFWSLFQSLPVGVVLSGPGAQVQYCNQAALDLLGVTEDELVGRTSLDPQWNCIHEDGSPYPGADRPIPRAIATRQPVRNEVMGVFRPARQDWVWLLMSAEPVLGEDGAVREVICSFADVTHRKQAELEQRASADRFRKVFADTAIGMVVTDLDGRVLRANRAFCALTGYTEQELSQIGILGLTHPEDLPGCMALFGRLLAGEIPSFVSEKRYVRKDGSVVWVRNSVSLLRNASQEPMQVIALAEDITDRKRAEDELRASEERFRNAFAHAATGMVLVDLEGRFIEANRAYCEITGYSQAELATLPPLAITHPEDVDKSARAYKQMLNGEIPSFVIEKRYVRKDGGLVWALLSATLLRDSRNDPCHAVGIVEDITERKRAEEELTALSRRLLHVQDEERRRLARELHDSTAQSIAALCMNLGVVSESANLLDAPARKALSECLEIGEQCIRELRTFSYLLHPPVLDDLGLSSALKWYVEGFVQRSRIEVALDIAPDLGRLPRELELTLFRVVQESLTNIHRHSGSRTAVIRIVRYANEVFMQVRDDGHGISAGSNTGNGTVARVGVGIAGMRERVRQAGGHLTIRSRPGGTDVEVLAPISPRPA